MSAELNQSSLSALGHLIRSKLIFQDPVKIAGVLAKFVHDGSQTHILNTDDVTVSIFAKDEAEFNKESVNLEKKYEILMRGGSRFFNVFFYLGLDEESRPKATVLPDLPIGAEADGMSNYADAGTISKYIFYTYFFIMIRGHAPTSSSAYAGQPVPKFLSAVLAMKESPQIVSNYLATFDLNSIDPNWVRHVPTVGLSKEAESRFGLGVAGYRLCSVFNHYKPDKDLDDNLLESVEVAKSFLDAGLDWDFHPATRSANLLSKYGNINKNCGNLILLCYQENTIKKMVAAKKLYAVPEEDPSHGNYLQWSELFESKSPIFAKR